MKLTVHHEHGRLSGALEGSAAIKQLAAYDVDQEFLAVSCQFSLHDTISHLMFIVSKNIWFDNKTAHNGSVQQKHEARTKCKIITLEKRGGGTKTQELTDVITSFQSNK